MSTREVLLEGPSPWGFRMTGGADVALSLRISRVNPGSKAAAKGVREGDLITSINKQPTKSLTNAESHALLRTVKENLLLGLNQDPDASPKRKGHKDRYHTPVETLPPQLSATDSTNNKGDKQTPSKSRRERRKKLKTRIKRIFGLGERDNAGSDQDTWERSTEASERSSVARNEDFGSEGRSEITSAKFSEDNASLFYDNDSTNEQFEKTVSTSEGRITSESELNIHKDEHVTFKDEENQECGFPIKKDPKANTSYSDVFDTCSDYLIRRDAKGRGGQEQDSVPPDIILSSNSQNNNSITETVVIKRVVEHQIVHGDVRNPTSYRSEVERESVSPIKKPNDLNNNKSGDKRAEAICSTDRLSGKRVHIFHSADEYKIDETADLDNADRKQNAEESVECIPERTVNLCKAIVSFEDGGCRNVETAGNSDRPFIVLEDDASLILNSRSTNTEPCGTQLVYEESDASRTGGGPLPMYYIPVRRYLDVIKEEASDISSDSERTKESSPSVKLNLNDGNLPEDWHPDGIDTSWRDGKSLDDVSDVPVASDSLSDTDLLVDDSKPPRYVPPNEHKKIVSKTRIYQNINNIKPNVNKSKMPSVNVVKSVVASYYNNKSKAVTIENVKPDTAKPIEEVQVCPALTETPRIGEDVEIVYIDTSDSDALSLRSDKLLNSSSSNRSSLELLEEEILDDLTAQVDHEIEILNNLTQSENVSIRVEDVSDKTSKSVGTSQIKKKDNDKDKYAEELIELSHSIISEIAENLSSGANSRVTSARSTPCRLLSPRSTPSKEIINRFKESTESIKAETSVKHEETITSQENSSLSTASTAKLAQPVLPLRQLSAEVIFDLPNGRSVLKELGLDPRFNYDSGSDYFPETSEYSEPSRLSFTSTEEIYGARSHSDGTHLETDPDRPLSSCASSIVFISGPGKVSAEPWIGLPLSEDPRFVVCFSPSQLSSNPIKIDQQKASELFDLHKKFIQRRGYHENSELKNLGPDLISIESNTVHEKHRYTPEILSEAANLQILQEYRNKRVNEKKESEKVICDAEDNRSGQDRKLNLGCSGDNQKGGTESGHNEEVGGSRLLELIQKQEVKSSTSPESNMLVEKSTTGETDRSDFDTEQYSISKRGDIAIRKMKKPVEDNKVRPKSLPPSGEIFRRVMYQEYMDKVAERMERRQMKVIKVSDHQSTSESSAEKAKHLETEFMNKVRERMEKLGLKEDESEQQPTDIQPDQETSDNLPKHLKEFVELLNEESGVWSPSGTPEAERKKFDFSSQDSINKEERRDKQEEDPGSAVWTPRSAGASPQLDRKKYRPINFQSPPPTRKHLGKQDEPELPKELPVRIVSSTSEGSTLSNQNSKLPPAQNPVITLLQKAREGQIPKGAQYLEQVETKTERISEASVGQHEVFYSIKKEYESDSEEKKKVVELSPRKFEGIGPTTKEGTPIALRSEVKEDNQQRWYKRMYDSLHKADHDKDYVTVRYKKKDLLPYAGWSSGYLSEPDRLYYDSDASISSKYATLDRRRAKSTRDTTSTHSDYLTTTSTLPRNTRYSAGVRHAVNIYKNQPGRIEDYEPGHSSIADKEKQQWLEEVMDIFDGEFKSHSRSESSAPPIISGSSGRSFTSVFKEGGYDSDSTLVFKKREGSDLSLENPKMAYKIIQRGGDVPLHGLRKPAPNRPREESEIEYFPISPTLTRIRIHKKRPEEKIFEPKAPVFSTYKRTARSSVTPSPPLRHSSRNSSTMKLVKSLRASSQPPDNRLVQQQSNIDFIKTRLCCRATRAESERGRKREKSPVKRVVRGVKPVDPSSKPLEVAVLKKPRTITKTVEPLRKSPELKAPAEVKKVMNKTPKKPMTITVAISPKGKELLRTPVVPLKSDKKSPSPTPSVEVKQTPVFSPTYSERSSSRSSSKAASSPTETPKKIKKETEEKKEKKKEKKVESAVKNGKKEKTKEEDKNGTEKKKSKKKGENGKKKNGVKKKDKENIPDEPKQVQEVEEEFGFPEGASLKPENFFQSLLLRDMNPPQEIICNAVTRSSSVAERIKKFNEPETITFKSEPSLKNLNVYLAQKKPVSESRFRSLERDPSVESPVYGTYEFFERLDKYDKHNDVWDVSQCVGSPTYDSVKGRSSSEPPHSSPTPSQDIYENIENMSPNISRSPSFRRIKRSPAKTIEGISGLKRKFRSKSLNEADKHDSTTSLAMSDIMDMSQYKSYILERLHSARKSEKFKELHNFYSSLERMAALQKTASNTDLRPRLRGEEIIDYDRWKQLRTKERSEVELSHIYEKLKDMQKEKGFLFKPKETVRWKGDSRLRSKEKSVEDLRQLFQKLSETDEGTLGRELSSMKDVYTPLWRGNSVADLANSLTSMSSFKRLKPPVRDDISPGRSTKPCREIGSRLWSSLSMDQVSALKTQLNEIYSTVSDLKRERIEKMRRNLERCEVDVSSQYLPPKLHVRSNSLVSKDQLYSPCIKRKQASKVSKADSISALPFLSETEKRKLSMSLSEEVRDRMKKKKHTSLVIPRETLGAVAVKKLSKKSKSLTPSTADTSPRTCYSLLSDELSDKIDKGKELLLVLTPEETQGDFKKLVDEWGSSEFVRIPPTATESSSSSSASTVIHLGSKDNLKQHKDAHQSSADLSEEKPKPLKPCQSFTNLKELFGDKRVTTYSTNPLRMLHKSRPYSSTDSLHKCMSPDNSKYNRSYLNMVKSGDVKKLKEKFESYEDIYNLFRISPEEKKYLSDPDLARDYFFRRENECKRRTVSPVPMNIKDRTMPRINVISKTAKLQAARRSRTVPPRLVPPTAGQVDKMRRHFEDIGLSLLGQMYTSAPDLRDIAPYLACEWAAHRSPSPGHASTRHYSPRIFSSPPAIADRRHDYSPYRSSSTPRRPAPILKSDPFSDQPFNPSIHTPVARYQPRPTTVTFKEPARPRNYVPAYTPSPESGREYIESEVNIHYKTPVRVEHKEYIEEGELARRQAEALRRIYQQQRRNKYLAELNDLHARRHQDYFTPSQKSPIPLNRYDDFPVEVAPPRPRDRTPEPKLVARALYNFLGQSSRELSFRRGDIIFVRRQIDKNWYEGEHNAMIGLFPINYVEIIPYDGIRTLPKKSTEGQARAKFNFQAQTHLELSLVKGELVLLTRRVDENWFEGRIGNKKGIFPVSYVQVLVEPGEVPYGGGKPVVAPASHSVMLNGAKDMGSQMQPPRPPSVGSPTMPKEPSQISQLLHIDTRSDPVPYRAMYNYKPQNDDELELREGDVVYVMEKCDDGWYVGSLHRNGQFGTFPGNYVQRIP